MQFKIIIHYTPNDVLHIATSKKLLYEINYADIEIHQQHSSPTPTTPIRFMIIVIKQESVELISFI